MDKVTVIGMDMGDKTHKAVGLNESGEVVDRTEVACRPEAVEAYLADRPGALLVIETGTHCRWVSELAQGHGHEVLVGNARKLRMIWANSRKNDWNDAEMLARIARMDRKLLHPVHLRGEREQKLLRLVKARDLLVKNRTAAVNMIRGFCKADGHRLAVCSSEAFARLEFEVPTSVRQTTKPVFSLLRELTRKIALYDKLITQAIKDDRAAQLLQTIPGVGPVTTAAYLASMGNPETFDQAREAGAYFGLVPRQDQSGQNDKQMRISKEGNAVVRRLLVTSAHYILGPFGKDSDLRRHGLRIAERGGKNARKRAVVAVARKLSVVMLAMIKKQEAYRPLQESGSLA